MGFDEFHTDGGRSRRRGSAIKGRRQAICHRQRQAYPQLARRRNFRRLQGRFQKTRISVLCFSVYIHEVFFCWIHDFGVHKRSVLRPAKVPAFQVSSPLTTLSGERSLCQKPTNLILFECLVLTNLILFEVSRNIVP
ncbi:unnamed protein product [Brassica oleracea var. botrytis]